MSASIFQITTQTGEPIAVGDRRLLLRSRAVQVKFPMGGGIIWNRPVAVVVQRDGSPDQILPVRDVTRMAQIALLVTGMLGAFLIARAFRK